MNTELQEMLGRLSDLTDEELADLRDQLVGAFDALDSAESRSAEDVAAMGEIADGLDSVRAEETTRAEAAAEVDAAAEALRGRVHPPEPNAEDGEPGDGTEGEEGAGTEEGTETGDGAEGTEGAEGEEGAGTEEGTEGAGTTEGGGERQPIAASAPRPRPSLSALSTRRSSSAAPRPGGGNRGDRVTTRVEAQRSFARRSGRSGRPVQAGDEITDTETLTDATIAALRTLGRGTGEPVLIASVRSEYPESRRLTGHIDEDTAKVDAVVGMTSLVAAGGICAPLDVDYSIDVMSDASEPVAASLPGFQANRGGLRFIKPPSMASVGAAGTTKWTNADDIAVDPANAATLKPVQTFVCGEEVEVVVDAYPTRLRFGNLAQRFSPEIVAANTELALANAARFREVERLTQIFALSTEATATSLLGASRDLLATLDQAAAAYRYRNRLPRSVRLRVILPEFTIDMLRTDLARELAHDRDGENNLALTDQQVTSLITARGFQVTWTMDAVPVRDTGTGAVTFSSQGFGAQADKQALVAWPAEIVFFLFAEGTFQNIDGGEVNFGVIRDSAMDAANDYETMVESFFATAKRQPESLAIVLPTTPNGSSAGTVATRV